MWSYSVMVITKDSESFNPGSSPGRTFFVSYKFVLPKLAGVGDPPDGGFKLTRPGGFVTTGEHEEH